MPEVTEFFDSFKEVGYLGTVEGFFFIYAKGENPFLIFYNVHVLLRLVYELGFNNKSKRDQMGDSLKELGSPRTGYMKSPS